MGKSAAAIVSGVGVTHGPSSSNETESNLARPASAASLANAYPTQPSECRDAPMPSRMMLSSGLDV